MENKHPVQPSAQPKKKKYNDYKRSAIRQYSSVISLLIMVPVFVVIALFVWVFPRSEKSEIENRKLTEFPSFTFEDYFSGKFTAGINTWFTDTTPFRDDFKNMGNNFKLKFGITTEDTVNTKDIGGSAKGPNKDKIDKNKNKNQNQHSGEENSKQSSGFAEVSDNNEQSTLTPEEIAQKDYTKEDAEYTVENGLVVVKQDGHYRAMELFGGGTGDAYVDALNTLRDQLDKKIRIYSMINPLSCEFYLPANFSDNNASQKEYFDYIAERLNDGIISVDGLSALSKHTEEAIYCRTDHHWMPLGAYYAAREFAKAADVEFKDIKTYKPVTIKNFVGTMYAFTGDANILNDPEDFTYYVSDNYDNVKTDFYDTSFNYEYTGSYFKEVGNPESNAYLTFFGGDEQIVKVRTGVKNGRKLLEVKDSYGNAIPGYLMNSFEEIYIVDMRYFNLNLVDFINQMGITDVLFTMATFSAFGGNSYNLPTLLSQNPGAQIVDHYKDGES